MRHRCTNRIIVIVASQILLTLGSCKKPQQNSLSSKNAEISRNFKRHTNKNNTNSQKDLTKEKIWDQNNQRSIQSRFFDLAQKNVEQAKEMAKDAPNLDLKKEAYGGIIKSWFPDDPLECYKWIISVSQDPKTKDILLGDLVATLESEHGEPVRWLQVAESPQFDSRIRKSIRRIAAKETGLVYDLLPGLDVIRQQSSAKDGELLNSFLEGSAEKDPDEVIDYLNSKTGPEFDRLKKGLSMTIAASLSKSNEQKAFEWCQTLPTGSMRDPMQYVLKDWLNTDSDAVSRSIGTMPRGGAKDEAVSFMARWLIEQGAKSDVRPWIKEISNQELAAKISKELDDPTKY